MCLCWITLGNLLECWLCKNVNLVLLWISRMMGTRWQCMTASSEKNIEENECGKVTFLQIRHFFRVKMGKASSESWEKQGSYCNAKTFSCNRWTAMRFASAPKITGQTKKPYFDPCDLIAKWSWGKLLKQIKNTNILPRVRVIA